jgi:fructose-1,6-bisphosphatase/inositol monophosphatase family enzyme
MRIDARVFVERMTLPVWQASAAARWLEGRVENTPKRDEETDAKSALTDADCVSQEILLSALREFFPRLEVEAEEDTPLVAAFAGNRSDDRVIVDPIDGTLRYVRRDGLYSIIVGLERDGRPEAAVVAVPQEHVVVRAVRGGGAEVSHAQGPFRPARFEGGERLLVSHRLSESAEAEFRGGGFTLLKAAGGAIGVAPLLEKTLGAIRVSQRPDGLSRRAWIAALPTREAGGAVAALDGPFPESFCEGVRTVVLASGERELDEMRRSLAAS